MTLYLAILTDKETGEIDRRLDALRFVADWALENEETHTAKIIVADESSVRAEITALQTKRYYVERVYDKHGMHDWPGKRSELDEIHEALNRLSIELQRILEAKDNG